MQRKHTGGGLLRCLRKRKGAGDGPRGPPEQFSPLAVLGQAGLAVAVTCVPARGHGKLLSGSCSLLLLLPPLPRLRGIARES